MRQSHHSNPWPLPLSPAAPQPIGPLAVLHSDDIAVSMELKLTHKRPQGKGQELQCQGQTTSKLNGPSQPKCEARWVPAAGHENTFPSRHPLLPLVPESGSMNLCARASTLALSTFVSSPPWLLVPLPANFLLPLDVSSWPKAQ